MNTSIIILTYNNLDYNIQCIESIRSYTEKGTYEIVVVDNGSTDGTREWLGMQSDLKLVLPTENTGFPKGCNLGIQAAEKENDILLLNNDIVVTPNWLDNLKKCLYSDEAIGAVGPTTNYAWNHQAIPVPYDSIQDMIKFSSTINNSDSSKWEPKIKLIGFCILIKRKVLDTVGLLDERFSPGNYEDDDICMRILTAGYKLYLCNDCFIHHYGNVSFKKDPEKFNNVLVVNREKFSDKWGFQAPSTDGDKYEVFSLINEPKEKDLNILQINCSFGETLLRAKYLYPNAKLFGIQTDKSISKIVNKLINLSTKEPDKFPLEFRKGFFDYILLDDYLSNVQNPWEFLKELKSYLKPDGYIIAKLPNLIHYSVIRDLLKGDFSYGSNMVLNKHQNNFFTYNDLSKIAEECGYSSPYVLYWYNHISGDDEKFLNDICNTSGEDMRWQFMIYKFIVKFQNSK